MARETIRRFRRPGFYQRDEIVSVEPEPEPAPAEIVPPPAIIEQESRTIRLFVSSPAYARDERQQIDTVLTRINATLGGAVRIAAIGQDMVAAVGADGPGFGAADCDAVIAIMRPRLATDSPASSDATSSEARGGVSGVLTAVQGRRAGSGLPDIHIFRYSNPAIGEVSQADADWEAGKQAFATWFEAKGGDFLSFDDFSTAEQFGLELEAQIGAWMARHGLPAPMRQPQPEPAVQPEPDVSADAASDAGLTLAEPEANAPMARASAFEEILRRQAGPIAQAEPEFPALAEPMPAEPPPAEDHAASGESDMPEGEAEAAALAALSAEPDAQEAPSADTEAELVLQPDADPVAEPEPESAALAEPAPVEPPPAEDHAASGESDMPEGEAEAAALAALSAEPDAPEAPSADTEAVLVLQPDADPVAEPEPESPAPAEAVEAETPAAEKIAETEPLPPGEPLEPEPAEADLGPGANDIAADLGNAETEGEALGGQPFADETGTATSSPKLRGRRRTTRKAGGRPEIAGDLAATETPSAPADIESPATIDPIAMATAMPEADAPAEAGGPEPEVAVQSDVPDRDDGGLAVETHEAESTGAATDVPPPESVEAPASEIEFGPPPAAAEVIDGDVARTAADDDGAQPVVDEPLSPDVDAGDDEAAHSAAPPPAEHWGEAAAIPQPVAMEAAAGETAAEAQGDVVAHLALDAFAADRIDDEQRAPAGTVDDHPVQDESEWEEKYRALEAETKNAVAVALRLERATRARVARTGLWRRRIAWALAASVIVALGAALQIVGSKWRNASVARQRLELSLAGASDQASSLASDLGQMLQKETAPSDADKALVDRARTLAGLLAKAGKFNPAETRAAIEGLLASAEDLARQGKVADGLKAMAKAQQQLRTASAAEPEQPDWLLRLAATDSKIGDILVGQKNTDEALSAFREAMAIGHALVLRDPANTEWQKSLSSAQQNVGDMLVAKGRLDDALATYREAQAIRKTLSRVNGDSPEAGRDLLEIDNAIGDLLTAQNHLDDALVSYREALAIATKLGPKNSADLKWSRALVLGNNKIGDVFLAKERIDDALNAYREALAIVKGLAAKQPDAGEWQSLTATCQERIGDALSAESHQDSALTAYQDALAILNAMAAKDPLDGELQRGLSETQLRIGWVLFNQGKIDASIAAHRESLAVVKAMIAKHPPDETRWKRDLMLDDGKIAQLLMAQGKHDEALPIYQDALAIAKEMGAQDPSNPEWQGTRGVVDSNVGRLLMEAGNRDDALLAYRDARTVSEALVLKDPGNVDWQTGLVIAYYNLAEAGDDKNTNLLRAVDILKRLDAAGVLPADKKQLIPKIDDELARLAHQPKRR